MTTKTTHTALPWRLNGSYIQAADTSIVIGDGTTANKEYIVRACNAFPALLAALEAAYESIDADLKTTGARYNDSNIARAKAARHAIAAALRLAREGV